MNCLFKLVHLDLECLP